ncbi:MAG TPA: type II toxin-antitoxin system HicA family toxin [Mucilaginibacter sp.]
MGKIDKLIERFQSKPKDFTWDELVSVLNHFGYNEMAKGKTGGSRRRFSHEDKSVIILHKPHPQPIIKAYVIKEVLEHLTEKGSFKND